MPLCARPRKFSVRERSRAADQLDELDMNASCVDRAQKIAEKRSRAFYMFLAEQLHPALFHIRSYRIETVDRQRNMMKPAKSFIEFCERPAVWNHELDR